MLLALTWVSKSAHLSPMVAGALSRIAAFRARTSAELFSGTTLGMLRMLLSKVWGPLTSPHPSSVLMIEEGDALDAHSLPLIAQCPAGTFRVRTCLIVFLTRTVPFDADKIFTDVPLAPTPRAGVSVTAATKPPAPIATAATS